MGQPGRVPLNRLWERCDRAAPPAHRAERKLLRTALLEAGPDVVEAVLRAVLWWRGLFPGAARGDSPAQARYDYHRKRRDLDALVERLMRHPLVQRFDLIALHVYAEADYRCPHGFPRRTCEENHRALQAVADVQDPRTEGALGIPQRRALLRQHGIDVRSDLARYCDPGDVEPVPYCAPAGPPRAGRPVPHAEAALVGMLVAAVTPPLTTLSQAGAFRLVSAMLRAFAGIDRSPLAVRRLVQRARKQATE